MSDDDDDVQLFDGTHRAATVKAATGMSDDDDDVPVIRWNASNKNNHDIAMSCTVPVRPLRCSPGVEFGSKHFLF
jgi:hypothetical protein